jgi:hypothetical protein
MCEYMASGMGKVAITFSDHCFPGCVLDLIYVTGDVSTGTTYYCPQMDHHLWLCPALGKYFKNSPQTLFINYKPLY